MGEIMVIFERDIETWVTCDHLLSLQSRSAYRYASAHFNSKE